MATGERDRHTEVLLEVDPTGAQANATVRREVPFHILILGDFRGGGLSVEAAVPATEGPRDPGAAGGEEGPTEVDRDNLDQVLAHFAPKLRIPAGRVPDGRTPEARSPEAEADTAPEALSFASLDDFHPDALYARASSLQPLRRWREELRNPASVRPGADPRGGRREGEEAEEGAGASGAPDRAAGPVGGSLLDAILQDQETTPPGGSDPGAGTGGAGRGREGDDGRGGLEAFLREAVAPHLVPDRPPDQARLLGEVENALSGHLRSLLHDHAFQALEALWRGVWFLVRGLETGPRVRVHLLHLPESELSSAVEAEGPAEGPAQGSRLARRLAQGPESGDPPEGWGLLVGAYSFGSGKAPVELLPSLAAVARTLGAPLLAEADPSIVEWSGEEDGTPGTGWEAFRRTPDARWLGLALPRFLLRLPYGEESDPCDALPFEEFAHGDAAPPHEHYLWGNSALLCALAMGRIRAERGWEGMPGSGLRVDGLPLDVRKVEGSPVAKPCAEVVLSEGEIGELMDQGLIPVASRKDSDAVHIPGIVAVASPPAPLAGRWMDPASRGS